MTTDEQLRDHLAAELAEGFARKHASMGSHSLAAQNYLEACALYARCGCDEFFLVAWWAAQEELNLCGGHPVLNLLRGEGRQL